MLWQLSGFSSGIVQNSCYTRDNNAITRGAYMDPVSAAVPQKEFMMLIGNGKWLLFLLAGHATVYIFYRLNIFQFPI